MKTPAVVFAITTLILQPVLGQYVFFEDDFESAPPAAPNGDPVPLLGNGMLIGAEVYDETNVYLYNYFTFDAPNITGDGARFCNIAGEQGGLDQGAQVLSVFSDYNNSAAHTAGGETSPGSGIYTGGDLVNAIVFVEYFVEEADLGTTVTLTFDAKVGDFQASPVLGTVPPFDPEAEAFIQVLDPANFFQAYPNRDSYDTDQIGVEWGAYSVSLTIDPSWEGKLLQAGFRSKTSNYQASGVFYDNVSLTSNRVEIVDPGPTITSMLWLDDVFEVVFESKTGFDYKLFKSTSVEGPYETEVDSNAGDGFEVTLFDDSATEAKAFYVLDEQPTPE